MCVFVYIYVCMHVCGGERGGSMRLGGEDVGILLTVSVSVHNPAPEQSGLDFALNLSHCTADNVTCIPTARTVIPSDPPLLRSTILPNARPAP